MSIFGYLLASQEAEEGDKDLQEQIDKIQKQLNDLLREQQKLNEKLETIIRMQSDLSSVRQTRKII